MKTSSTEPDDQLGFHNIPHWEGYYRNAQFLQTEYFVKAKHSTLGLNNKELDLNALKNENVILVVGDSFTYGSGVPQEQSYPAITQQLVGENYTIINAGTPGYDLSQYLEFVKLKSPLFSPDIIVVGLFVGNDLGKQLLYTLDDDGNLVRKQLPTLESRRLLSTCTRNSHACAFLANGITHSKLGDALRRWGILAQEKFSLDQQEEYNKNKALVEKIIKELQKETQNNRQQLAVLIIPLKEQVDDSAYNAMYPRGSAITRFQSQKDLHAFLAENNIPSIDPLPLFRQLNKNNTFYYTYDGHCNERGYFLLGYALAKYIHPNPILNIEKISLNKNEQSENR